MKINDLIKHKETGEKAIIRNIVALPSHTQYTIQSLNEDKPKRRIILDIEKWEKQ